MKVGILGSGEVARALANGFISQQHEVKFGTRQTHPEPLEEWIQAHGKGRASFGPFRAAAQFGDPVVLATLGTATEEVVRHVGAGAFAGKLVIDATNPLVFHPQGPPTLALGPSDSLGERVQGLLPKAKVVKAFNTVGNVQFYRPKFSKGTPTMFIAGNDASAKERVVKILSEFGWSDVLDVGEIERSRPLEALVLLWVAAAMRLGSFSIGFSVLRP